MTRYHVYALIRGRIVDNSFDSKKEAEHFAKLVNGRIEEVEE